MPTNTQQSSKSDPRRSNTLTCEMHVHTTQEGFWSWRRNAIPLLGPCQRSAIVLESFPQLVALVPWCSGQRRIPPLFSSSDLLPELSVADSSPYASLSSCQHVLCPSSGLGMPCLGEPRSASNDNKLASSTPLKQDPKSGQKHGGDKETSTALKTVKFRFAFAPCIVSVAILSLTCVVVSCLVVGLCDTS